MAFNFNPVTGLLDTSAFPSEPASEEDARGQFMTLFNQLKDYINGALQTDIDSKQGFKLTANSGLVKSSISNCNSATEVGYYAVSAETTNKPNSSIGILQVFKRADNHIYQTLLTATNPIVEFKRISLDAGVTWSPWQSDEALKGESGYQKLPSGLIIQWGSHTFAHDGSTLMTANVNFSIPFTSYVIYPDAKNVTRALYLAELLPSLSGGLLTMSKSNGSAITTGESSLVKWIAIGY